MKKLLFFLFISLLSVQSKAQVLNVPLVVQEQNQWCWAGCSKCMLDYFGDTLNQCDIAEYARTSITWTSFGTVDCCVDPSQGCNYWNYMYGSGGSIQDILIHFYNVQNNGLYYAIPTATIQTEISGGRPFVIRWGWTSGGGHFIVGHGIDTANNVSYMNPWPGEGFHIAPYSWVVSDGVHDWTHTIVLNSSPLNVAAHTLSDEPITVYPNPLEGTSTVHFSLHTLPAANTKIEVRDVTGRLVLTQPVFTSEGTLELGADFSSGIYFVQLINGAEISPAVKLLKTN